MTTLTTRRALLVSGAITVPGRGAAWAQESGRTFRLGILNRVQRQAPASVAFYEELGKAGFVEGKNLIVDWRDSGSRPEQIAASVAELVQLAPDVLVLAAGVPGFVAAQAATRTIPILGVADDMVASGLVRPLVRDR
jgi:putative tryptophan/tyrosine transport system substrate-binding protein